MKIGKVLMVGTRKVRVKKALAEGASGYVYAMSSELILATLGLSSYHGLATGRYEVKDQSSAERLAMKQVFVGDNYEALRQCELEIEVMKVLKDHPNIVAFDRFVVYVRFASVTRV